MSGRRAPTLLDGLLLELPRLPYGPPRRDLLRASRFVLDGDASALLGDLLREEAPLVLSRHRLARSPYPVTWVEYVAPAYWRAATGEVPSPTGDARVGYLVADDRVWCASESLTQPPVTFPFTFRLHAAATPAQQAAEAAALGISPALRRAALLGGPGRRGEWDPALAEEIAGAHRVELVPGADQWGDAAGRVFTGGAGDLKVALALLLLLAFPPRRGLLLDPVARRIGSHRGHRAVYHDHVVVRLALDRPRVVGEARASIAASRPRRRHEVRGHWCQSRATAPGCEHDWQPVAGGRNRLACGRCGGRVWWRREHERGDAALGVVLRLAHGAGR